MKNRISILYLMVFISACQTDSIDWLNSSWTAEEILLDNTQSMAPNLFVAEGGQAYLTYLHLPNDSMASLELTQLKQEGWAAPQMIASGTDWFVNWADFPSIVAFPQNSEQLAAHWLQKRAAGTYDYDVKVSISSSDGQRWTTPFIPHRDSVAAEHGFVSLLPLPNGRIFVSWLDGRFTKVGNVESSGGHEHGHGGGAMTLRAAEFDAKGQLFAEVEIDHRVCDCCQTDTALGPDGPMVVYRDRSEEEIRDIYFVRRVEGVWQLPQKIGEDNWQINGCPVNGPAIAAQNNAVAVAWFTMAQDTPKVQVVFSKDGGQSFGAPIRIDRMEAIGRVDIVLVDEDHALVSFLEDDGEQTWLKVVPVDRSGKQGAAIIEYPSDLSRRSGFPILEQQGSDYLLAFTVVDGENTHIKTMRLSWDN